MTYGINGFIIDVSEDGITGSGPILGTTRPNHGDLLLGFSTRTGQQVIIYVRRAYIKVPVSSSGNNKFLVPVVYGEDEFVLFVNGLAYGLGLDFLVDGNEVTWLNPNVTIKPDDEVIAWGPGNDHTALGITYEVLSADPDSFRFIEKPGAIEEEPTSWSHFILNAGNQGTTFFPAEQKSIFLYINGKSYFPGVDFVWNPEQPTNIYWHPGADKLQLQPTDRVHAMYFNNYETQPFRLADALERFEHVPTEINPEEQVIRSLANPPKPELLFSNTTNLNGVRYIFKEDYNMTNRNWTWLNPELPGGGNLEFVYGDFIDIWYFKDTSFGTDFFSEFFLGSHFIDSEAIVNERPLAQTKGLLFLSGFLQIPQVADNGLISTYDYEVSGFNITWISNDPPVGPNDQLVWSGFKDEFSGDLVQIYYENDVTTATALGTVGDTTKVIGFLNGQAQFTQGITGDSLSAGLTVSEGGSAQFDIAGVTITSEDVGMFLFFKDKSYADGWQFDVITGPWDDYSDILSKRPTGVTTTMVFVNGQRQTPGTDYTITADRPQQLKNVNIPSVRTGSHTLDDLIVVVYI
jgi:hypothetical protein